MQSQNRAATKITFFKQGCFTHTQKKGLTCEMCYNVKKTETLIHVKGKVEASMS